MHGRACQIAHALTRQKRLPQERLSDCDPDPARRIQQADRRKWASGHVGQLSLHAL